MPIVNQLGAERIREARDGMLRAAIGRLQGNRTVGERRSDLDDSSRIAGQHAAQRGHGSIDRAEIRDFGGTLELRRRDVRDSRKDRRHRIVYPHVDRPELVFDASCRCLDLVGVGHVRRHGQAFSAQLIDFAGGDMKTFGIARDEADMRSFARKGANGGAAHARRRAGNHNDSAGITFSHSSPDGRANRDFISVLKSISANPLSGSNFRFNCFSGVVKNQLQRRPNMSFEKMPSHGRTVLLSHDDVGVDLGFAFI